MRWIAILLSMYSLLLALRPCEHLHNAISDAQSENKEHGSDQGENNLCSPFCVCSCSTSIDIVPLDYVELEDIDFPISVLFGMDSQKMQGDFMPCVWQPPKL